MPQNLAMTDPQLSDAALLVITATKGDIVIVVVGACNNVKISSVVQITDVL